MQRQIRVKRYKVCAVVISMMVYVMWLFIYAGCKNERNIDPFVITFVSWVGIAASVFYVLLWHKFTNRYFTLFNIFLAFFVVFNFGQCLMWAVGIHTNEDIGQKVVWTVYADNNSILQSQLLFIISLVTLNCGALLAWDTEKIKNKGKYAINAMPESACKCLYYTSVLLAAIVIPITLYKAGYRLVLSQIYGYRSLYYGVASEIFDSTLVNLLSSLFAPCLFGLLIGSRYKRTVAVITYSIFAVYAVLSLLAGDRGEWIMLFMILFWAHYEYSDRFPARKLVKWGVIGVASLFVITAIVEMRNVGLSWDGFLSGLFDAENNAIVSLLREFGTTMSICIILLKNKVVSPYGNTFLMSIPTLFGTGLANSLFGVEYVQLHTWFPFEYLNISSGTDFSMLGEAVLNCGEYWAPLVILIEGFILGKIVALPYRNKLEPLKLCLFLSCMAAIIKWPRTTVWLIVNGCIYYLIIFPVLYCIVWYVLMISKHKRSRKYG